MPARQTRTYGRFVDVSGTVPRHRSAPAGTSSLSSEDVKDHDRLVAVLSALHKRVQSLEGSAGPEFMEVEKRLAASGTVTIQHNFNCPVRYSVVYWKGAAMPNLNVNETSSDLNNLVLNTTVAGLAVIRVEKSQHTPTKGT